LIKALAANPIESEYEFRWTRELRYYWDDNIYNNAKPGRPTEDLDVRMVNTLRKYGFEYLGN
jgi:hypothetical protein